MEIFEIKNLSFCYTESKRLILNNINIKIESNDFILICGESGCGKTTLLRHFKEELAPFGYLKGEVINKGVSVGYVMQDPDSQIVTDKVWHELAFGLENMGLGSDEIKLRCGEIASFFGINNWYHKNTNELSGGQKQILNLACVLAMKPDIIVLDEPLSQLDPLASIEFINAVVRINREMGITIIMSEHNLNDVMAFAKKVIVMDKGSIVACDKPEFIMALLREKEHIMQMAMPVCARIHSALSNEKETAVTVSQCRNYISEYCSEKISIEVNERSFNEWVIKVRELFFAYEKDKDIIKNMDIEVKRGEVFAVVGGNGAGKTTALRLIAGFNKAYYGKLEVKGKIAMLSQSPISLFTERTVLLDLKSTGRNIEKAVNLLEIENLLEQNPNDLSGGEIQRCAIAKLLLSEPDILLLDEPTKGIDAFMKKKLGNIIRELGITVVMVSHDLEFCAEFADRCGMFFDGQIVNCSYSHKFFSDNFFYTTPARKIAQGVVENAIIAEEVINAFGKSEKIKYDRGSGESIPKDLVNKKEERARDIINKRVILSSFIIFLFIPIVIWIGIRLFDDRKYFAVSLAIILMTMIPFFMLFESRRARAREIVIVAVMCSICVAGRIVFAPFPQIKPLCALVIISGICLGCESGFMIGALSGFCSNFYFGQGPWTPWQMFALGIIGFTAGVMRKIFINKENMPKTLGIAVFGFLVTVVIYGVIMNTSSVIMYQPEINFEMILAACATGLIFDFTHGVSTFVFTIIFAKPIFQRLIRVKKKFGVL